MLALVMVFLGVFAAAVIFLIDMLSSVSFVRSALFFVCVAVVAVLFTGCIGNYEFVNH